MPYPPPATTIVRKPTLIPDFDPPFEINNRTVRDANGTITKVSTMERLDPVEAFKQLQGTSVPASGQITITAAGSAGDTITAVIRGVSVTIITGAADTVTTLAAALALAINTTPALEQYVDATSAAGVVTVNALHSGQIPNGFSFTVAVTGTNAATVTTAFAGGTGDLVTPLESIVIQVGRDTIALYANRPIVGSPAIRAALSGTTFAVT